MLAHLAEEVVAEMAAKSRGGLRFDADRQNFVYDGLDDYYHKDILQQAEALYGTKLRDYRAQQIEENARKRGFEIKRVKTENSEKIKMMLIRRVYGA